MKSDRRDYPRPQLVRDSWETLNGTWAFAFDDENRGEGEKWYRDFPKARSITVPFTYETEKSGIGDTTPHEHVWYRRRFSVDPETLSGGRLLLHFEGVDHRAQVWVNGQRAGGHTGGYARFSLDVTDLVQAGENTLTVKADDSLDRSQPRGKQRWIGESFRCWYVQNTGIWKTVWMEYVPETYLPGLKLTPVLSEGALSLCAELSARRFPEDLCLTAAVSFEGAAVNRVTVPVRDGRVSLKVDLQMPPRDGCPDSIHTWSPDCPALYDLELRLCRGDGLVDEVRSYFGMREISIKGDKVLLNGAPLYQRLVLDQGYWPDAMLTPPDGAALESDVDKILRMGYNGVRKHQKIEDERFLYWADVKGLLVWSEAPAAYVYNDDVVQLFTAEWMEILRQNYSHPAIITWTPFNESWGVPEVWTDRAQQRFTEAIYSLTKAFDPMRPVIVNDGWEHTVSDIITLHDYEGSGKRFHAHYMRFKEEILASRVCHCRDRAAFANGYGYRGQPVIISKYGGFASAGDGWGYGDAVKTEAEYLRRYDALTTAIRSIPYICGFCFTQATDVQQEINGLMDMARQFKVDPDRIREINTRPLDEDGGLYR